MGGRRADMVIGIIFMVIGVLMVAFSCVAFWWGKGDNDNRVDGRGKHFRFKTNSLIVIFLVLGIALFALGGVMIERASGAETNISLHPNQAAPSAPPESESTEPAVAPADSASLRPSNPPSPTSVSSSSLPVADPSATATVAADASTCGKPAGPWQSLQNGLQFVISGVTVSKDLPGILTLNTRVENSSSETISLDLDHAVVVDAKGNQYEFGSAGTLSRLQYLQSGEVKPGTLVLDRPLAQDARWLDVRLNPSSYGTFWTVNVCVPAPVR